MQASKDLKLSSEIFFLLTKKIDIAAQNLKQAARVALLYAENTRHRKSVTFFNTTAC